MFDLIYKKYFKKGTFNIFVYSFLTFIVLNIIENLIHYNIGTNHDVSFHELKLTIPSSIDWTRIILIMFIFACLQGGFTSYFSVCDVK
jgi:hypothetical protein